MQKKLRKTVKKVKSKKGVQNFDKDIDIQVENFFSQSSSFSNNEEEDPSENLFEEDLDFNDMDINEEVNDKKFHNHSLKDDLDKNLEGEEEFESFQEDHYIADEGDEDSEEMAFDDPFDDINDIEGEEEEDEGWS
ncbi:MAG: hypothetical protein GDA46_06410 [Bdellovibrionales bacterium]|nr:hypothetical protein [Bdellovibrionales bacterium]